MATRTRKTAAPVEEIEEVEDEVELDELDDDVDGEVPTKGAKKTQEITFGVRDLADYLTKKVGKEIKTKDLRTQIRRMAREEKPRVDREVVAGNRSRYDWPDGLKDPEVQAIVKAVTAGELEAGKKEALDALKERKAAQKAAGEVTPKKRTRKPKAEEVEEIEEVDDDFDEDLLDDDE